MPDPIQQRVEVQYDGREMREASRDVGALGDANRDVTTEAKDASRELNAQGSAVGALNNQVTGMVAGWASFTAISSTVIRLIGQIGKAAKDAEEHVAKLGSNARGLASNIGGQRADQTVEAINRIARAENIGPQGRNELIESAATLTDLRDYDQPTLERDLGNLARLQRATTQGGGDVARALVQLQTRAGLSSDEATDQLTGFLNSGFSASDAVGFIDRAGDDPLGVMDIALASRSVLGPQRARRAIPTLLDAVNKTDDAGRMTAQLRGAGVDDGMSSAERIEFLANEFNAGRITEAQLNAALGSSEAGRQFAPIAQAIGAGAMDDACFLRERATADDAIDAQLESRYVRFFEDKEARDLRQQLAKETHSAAASGAAQGEAKTFLAERGYGDPYLGALRMMQRLTPAGVLGLGQDLAAEYDRMQQDPANMKIEINHNVENTQLKVVGQENPRTQDTNRGSQE